VTRTVVFGAALHCTDFGTTNNVIRALLGRDVLVVDPSEVRPMEVGAVDGFPPELQADNATTAAIRSIRFPKLTIPN
jgi:methylthioribose-1-phosphate isomerase